MGDGVPSWLTAGWSRHFKADLGSVRSDAQGDDFSAGAALVWLRWVTAWWCHLITTLQIRLIAICLNILAFLAIEITQKIYSAETLMEQKTIYWTPKISGLLTQKWLRTSIAFICRYRLFLYTITFIQYILCIWLKGQWYDKYTFLIH